MVEKQLTEERQHHHSFVLRIWWEEDADVSRVWRGWIQHAATGEVVYVKTLDELLTFIEAKTSRLAETET